jgi:starch phosphorylase
MNNLQTFQVFPAVPEALSFLVTLSRNMWWCWHLDAIELFRRINPRLWAQAGRNPLAFSTLIPQQRLEELSKDDSFIAHLERVQERFESEVASPANEPESFYREGEVIAYLSMEFGIHESLPLFAGGLGVLAGDHLKSASDMALPLVGIGLLFRQGYFHQFLDDSGWQQEEYPETDIYHLPLSREKNSSGGNVRIKIAGPEGDIHAIVWRIQVGRIPLFLLDTNISDNPPAIREITTQLYGGDLKMRLAQEVLLGIGGVRALEALGIYPTIFHLNEGHSAFSGLERVARTVSNNGVDLQTAMEIVPRTTIFTTHTPVSAGYDEFPPDLVRPYLASFQDTLEASVEEIISWGQAEGAGPEAPFSMFVLGLRLSQHHNGVSELHGKVARRMWSKVWPGWPEDEVPISHVTNGVHIPSWISIENSFLFDRYLGPEWYLHSWNPDITKRIDDIYDEEIWRAREMSRSRLIRACREIMVKQYGKRNAPRALMQEAGSVLDPEVLTIGFARRFATYKRANLLFTDPDRLEAIVNSENQPVQFIFAGKAHPKNKEGKEVIQQIIQSAQKPNFRHRIVFLEDYDINMSRYLVQGADVWLNTPRRPLEACGTSGMKAAVNGVLNVSILDGWWCEGYSEERGWAIGNGEEYTDPEYQDTVESHALYNVLENDVIPCFYDRKNGEAPKRWISMIKASMKMAMEYFCSHRMVKKYEDDFYRQAIEGSRSILENNAEMAKKLVNQRKRLFSLWRNIQIQPPFRKAEEPLRIGDSFQVTSEVFLGELRPDEVDVELYYGRVQAIDAVSEGKTAKMTVLEDRGNGHYLYGVTQVCDTTGRFGFTVRARPVGDDKIKYAPGLISWA